MADVGTGASLTFATTGFTADIRSIDGQDISREVIDTTHLGTTSYKTFMPSDLADPGGLEFEIMYDPNAQPPVTSAAEVITVTFPVPAGLSTGATMSATGFISSWNWKVPLEDLMTANITVKFSGTITFADAA